MKQCLLIPSERSKAVRFVRDKCRSFNTKKEGRHFRYAKALYVTAVCQPNCQNSRKKFVQDTPVTLFNKGFIYLRIGRTKEQNMRLPLEH
ncbi:hypothetical protein ACHWQZ_G017085 [Mnemiopsis leidyi]